MWVSLPAVRGPSAGSVPLAEGWRDVAGWDADAGAPFILLRAAFRCAAGQPASLTHRSATAPSLCSPLSVPISPSCLLGRLSYKLHTNSACIAVTASMTVVPSRGMAA